ncbi:PQQ-binding-like beta-propeller repeat protein [Halorussus gelatinilyticus]|uniref:PQQ-binding-like beta-propeller repeat protein n=1 Tax=Halorussus gelatinilyticus TaxID=2937524 RepID=A0A8U0ILV4_9EURY|nr:PQQ-binding-like beta-propeller repeat protein [Halorussus gelatinilyticus]UPW02123.1 PQQ-binding-like beta-propeller repeat protein [Halorussus gelatinilyticus]
MNRRQLLATLGGVALFGTAGCATNACSPSQTAGFDPPPTAWPRPRFGPTNVASSDASTDGPTPRGPPDDPETAWTCDLPDEASDGGATSAPVVADGTVYVATGLPGRYRQDGADGYLSAIDAATGERRWSNRLPKGATGPPTLVSDRRRVVVGARDDTLRGFDPAGEKRWEIGFDSPPNTPAVVGDAAYVTTADGTVRAVALPSGDACWTLSQKRPRDHLGFGRAYRSGAKPAVADGVVYAPTATADDEKSHGVRRGRLLAIDAESGERRWQYWFDTDQLPRPPAVRDGTVYVAGGDALHALDAESGERRWSFATGYRETSAPAVADGTVYFTSKNVYGLDADTGDEQWRHVNLATVGSMTHDDRTALTDAPAVADGTVYVAVGALDAETGDERWGEFGNRPDSQYFYPTERDDVAADGPALADGAVYVATTYGEVHKFGSGSGDA